MWRDVPALSVYVRNSERPRKQIAMLSLSGVLQDGQTLRKIARALRIHNSTAHRWRQRLLAAPKTVQPRH